MDDIHAFEDYPHLIGAENEKDTLVQLVLSIAIGLGAFLAFCLLRTRWTGLYAARKKHKNEASPLPELPDSFFGWIPALWRITEQQVLASAGLDAFVFLRTFKLATKFLTVTAFFALVVIKPVHDQFLKPNGREREETFELWRLNTELSDAYKNGTLATVLKNDIRNNYLWMYIAFAYLFTGLALYLVVAETRRIIEIRQEYLGSQATITDRTIRLSGIPKEFRSEARIKEFVEDLEIGKVESVTLCRNWKELDNAMIERMTILRKLEEAWTVHLGYRRVERNLESLPIAQPSPPGPTFDRGNGDDEESSRLIAGNGDSSHIQPYSRARPKTKIRYGRFKLQSVLVDAIDYYEEKLHKIDARIKDLRGKEFEPTPLAFVTMDSVAACQMAVQALLDPSPLEFLAKPSPAPADVVWPNTYLPRTSRVTRAWIITAIVGLLTIFWSFILVPLATALNLDNIEEVWPTLGHALKSNTIARSFVQTQLPTLLVSLLVVLVPYLYDWLANLQGMTSQGDVELSVISKNFFFTFFNFFIVFTILGTLSNFLRDGNFDKPLKDVNNIAENLATSLATLLNFYLNYIILQGFGLFPLRLLEFGSVALYPISLIGAKTPRDYAELVQPPIFSYGFYLPQTLLIFIICIVYSVLPGSWQILLAGLVYFAIGYMVYKYQLLYAMDHRQHSSGKSWTMICDRIILGVILFQLTTTGEIAPKAPKLSPLLLPLLAGTLYFTYVYGKTYKPLMSFIALRSIRGAEHSDLAHGLREHAGIDGRNVRSIAGTSGGRSVESQEAEQRFVNPSLIAPLEDVWIVNKSARTEDGRGLVA
ncbi:MAG: hypothetical protein M1822_003283 [Bathelium mastoideum]|nr:MAG: hypothetical protein M1822_003283 [Bathelium mastoideum]